jgi:hypothetical protein
VAATVVYAHYFGDACQPLHCSSWHDGEPAGKAKSSRGHGLHSVYEKPLLRQNARELLLRLKKGRRYKPTDCSTQGWFAAKEAADHDDHTWLNPDTFREAIPLWSRCNIRCA